jgi:hypothetical protein
MKIGNAGNAADFYTAAIASDHQGIVWAVSARSDLDKEGQAFIRQVRTSHEICNTGVNKGQVRNAAGTWKRFRHSRPSMLLSNPVKIVAFTNPIDGSLRAAVLTEQGVCRLEPKSSEIMEVSVLSQRFGEAKAIASNGRYLAVMQWTESEL